MFAPTPGSKITFRKPIATDLENLAACIAADPDHAGHFAPEFWTESRLGVACFVVEDEKGPVLYVRAGNVMRLHIQFDPAVDKTRTRHALEVGFGWLNTQALKRGFQEFIFESKSPALIWFCRKLGFKRSENEVKCDL